MVFGIVLLCVSGTVPSGMPRTVISNGTCSFPGLVLFVSTISLWLQCGASQQTRQVQFSYKQHSFQDGEFSLQSRNNDSQSGQFFPFPSALEWHYLRTLSTAIVKRRKCHSPSTGINKGREAAKLHTTPKTITHNTAFSGVSAGVERLWFNKNPVVNIYQAKLREKKWWQDLLSSWPWGSPVWQG